MFTHFFSEPSDIRNRPAEGGFATQFGIRGPTISYARPMPEPTNRALMEANGPELG
jgi:hypothetical protein